MALMAHQGRTRFIEPAVVLPTFATRWLPAFYAQACRHLHQPDHSG